MSLQSGYPPIRILFVFARLAVGGAETMVRLLAAALDPARYRIEVIACFHKPGMTDRTYRQLEANGVAVDRTPYHLSFDDTVAYLASRVPAYDLVVSCQNVADIHPALDRLHLRPPLIEHGPSFQIPAMVDTAAFDPATRAPMRSALGISDDVPLIGWLGRLDEQKRVEDFIDAAALVHAERPDARFVVIGGADAFVPEYAVALRRRATALGLRGVLTFLGDRADVPELLSALDIFVSLSRGEGMSHAVAEAGAAGLPVVATRDDGPAPVAAEIVRLIDDPALRARLGTALRAKVDAEYSVAAVVPQWQALFADTLAGQAPVQRPAGLFRSFLQGGFESSTHRRAHDRKRVDVIAASHHDVHAEHDYRELLRHGILTVRDGLRWHLIERTPGRYDWSSLDRQLAGAKAAGSEVIWDLLHYGWPDDIQIWMPEFVTRFAAFAAAAARHIGPAAPGERRFYAPINEISFFSWGGGDAGYLNPFANGRGHELKVQLARASIAAMEAILLVDPAARFVHADPVINVVTDAARPHEAPIAEGHRVSQFQGWDMIAGKAWPQIGGRPGLLDIVGVNFYHNNQWIHGGPPLAFGDPRTRPFRDILAETYARYGRPIFVAETGTEGDARGPWLDGILTEVDAAIALGVPVEGICLYPILDHPGWDDDRYCPNGLLSCAPLARDRIADSALAAVIARRVRGDRPPTTLLQAGGSR